MTLVAILVGVIVGAATAALHLWASWQASQQVAATRSGLGAWLGLPLRIGLPAVVLLGLARWTPVALVAAMLTFGIVGRVAVRMLVREEAP